MPAKQKIDMKIISSPQLKELDKYTIAHEPIESIDLMERAAHALTNAIIRRWDKSFEIVVFAGKDNTIYKKRYPKKLDTWNKNLIFASNWIY